MLAGKPRPAPAHGMSPSYRLFRRCVIALGRILFGFVAVGEEKAPREGALIVASNHARYLDPILVCMAVPRRLQWMAKKELFVGPLDRFFALLGAFPVDRKKGGRAALRTALVLLANGWALGIFPEGTHRTGPGADRAPKSGVAMLAARGNAPVLPVFVGKIPTPLQRLKGKKLRAIIGDPIYTHNTNEKRRAYGEVSADVLSEIYAMSDQGGDVKSGGSA
jgi:1-acyl-sn-glycerol-3-phosphate acyltransferase